MNLPPACAFVRRHRGTTLRLCSGTHVVFYISSSPSLSSSFLFSFPKSNRTVPVWRVRLLLKPLFAAAFLFLARYALLCSSANSQIWFSNRRAHCILYNFFSSSFPPRKTGEETLEKQPKKQQKAAPYSLRAVYVAPVLLARRTLRRGHAITLCCFVSYRGRCKTRV